MPPWAAEPRPSAGARPPAEPATELRLHAGLVTGFVTADPHGPPASVVVALRDGALPEGVAVLLGARVSAAVAESLAAGRSGRWLHLDLVEWTT